MSDVDWWIGCHGCARARARRFAPPPPVLAELLQEPRLVLAGTSAGRVLDWTAPDGDWPAETYLAETELAALVLQYERDRDDTGDLLPRTVREPWPFPPPLRVVPAVVAAAEPGRGGRSARSAIPRLCHAPPPSRSESNSASTRSSPPLALPRMPLRAVARLARDRAHGCGEDRSRRGLFCSAALGGTGHRAGLDAENRRCAGGRARATACHVSPAMAASRR
jgi:hypothetical protein